MKLKRCPGPIELELRDHLTGVFLGVIRQGVRFRPRLVTSGGQIVGKVPTEIDDYLMRAHLVHKETKDEDQARLIAAVVAGIIMSEIRVNYPAAA